MTHRHLQPIAVRLHQDQPIAFQWADRHYRIAEIVDRWTLQTLWWEGEVQRTYYQVLTPTWGLYCLFVESGEWYLDTVTD